MRQPNSQRHNRGERGEKVDRGDREHVSSKPSSRGGGGGGGGGGGAGAGAGGGSNQQEPEVVINVNGRTNDSSGDSVGSSGHRGRLSPHGLELETKASRLGQAANPNRAEMPNTGRRTSSFEPVSSMPWVQGVGMEIGPWGDRQ